MDAYARCQPCEDTGPHDHSICTEIALSGDTCACLCRPCATCAHPHGEHHVDAPSRCCEDGCACLAYDYGMDARRSRPATYRCADPQCPGRPYRASEQAHRGCAR